MSIRETAAQVAALGAGAPVRMADALIAGITRSALRAACDGGLLMRPAHGFIAPVNTVRDDANAAFIARCRALLDRRPHAVLSHWTAANIHRLPAAGRSSHTIHCTDPNPRSLPDVVAHRGVIPTSEVVEVDGLRVTSLLHTSVDIARSSPLPHALVTMDAALRLRTIALNKEVGRPDHRRVEDPFAQDQATAELQALAAHCAGRSGAKSAREAAWAASPLAESPAESWSRGHFLLAGIVPLGLQVRMVDADGRERRLDFLLAEGLAGEVDGLVKYDGDGGAQRLRDEKTRDLLLERVGVRTLRWTGVEAFRDPADVVRMIGQAISLHRAARTDRLR